jgi:acid phosphatase (class A)
MRNIITEISEKIQQDIENLNYDNKKLTFEKVPFMTDNEWKNLIEPPPSNTSKSTQKDLLEVYYMTSKRTKSQIDLVMKIDSTVESVFLPELKKLKLKYPKDIVDSFWNVYYPIVSNIKNYFNRPRTWQLAPKYGMVIDIVISESAQTPSYPSGHSAYAYILASILGDLYPIHRTSFSSISEKVGWARKVQGVHYQTDIDAARKLTTIVYPKIKEYLKSQIGE